jgi:transposase
MIFLPRAVKLHFATEPSNLRKSFDGLSNEVRQVLALNPMSGHVFIFLNRRRNQVKLIVWTRGGFTIMHKRLERGTFAFGRQLTSDAGYVVVDVHELGMLREGIDIERGRMSNRWDPKSRRGEPR